jgi:hypothetical protein
MGTISQPDSHCHRMQRQLRWWFIFSFVLAAGSIGLSVTIDLMGNLPGWLRYVGVAVAVLVTAFWVRAALRFQRSLDEMQRRVFLEVTSVIGIAAIAWLYLFPVLEKTGLVKPLTHDAYALALMPLGLVAWLITVRRYR